MTNEALEVKETLKVRGDLDKFAIFCDMAEVSSLSVKRPV